MVCYNLNPEGKIAALMYYPLSNGRNVDEIIRLVDSLQMTVLLTGQKIKFFEVM